MLLSILGMVMLACNMCKYLPLLYRAIWLNKSGAMSNIFTTLSFIGYLAGVFVSIGTGNIWLILNYIYMSTITLVYGIVIWNLKLKGKKKDEKNR